MINYFLMALNFPLYLNGFAMVTTVKQITHSICKQPTALQDKLSVIPRIKANFKPNPVKRELADWHQDISEMFNHDKENRWCLDCHDFNNRDSLRLASGK